LSQTKLYELCNSVIIPHQPGLVDLPIGQKVMKTDSKKTIRHINLHSLEKSLEISWRLTYYGCLLFDWCRPINRGWFSAILRSLAITLILSTTLCHIVFCFLPIILVFSSPSNNRLETAIVPLSYYSMLPLSILTWIQFLICRRQLLAFFRDWVALEKSTPDWSVDHGSIKRVVQRTYAAYFIAYGSFLTYSVIYFFTTADLTKLKDAMPLTYFQDLLASSWFSSTFLPVFLIISGLEYCLLIVFELIPSFVFYHAAKNVEAMETEIQNDIMMDAEGSQSTQEVGERIKQIWARFENLNSLVNRANKIFGPMIILNHGVSLFSVCCTVYSLFYWIQSQGKADAATQYVPWQGLLLYLLVLLPRIIFSIYLMSKLKKRSNSLTGTVTQLLAFRCNFSGKEERCNTKAFLNRLQFAGLSACPGGFYHITPSVLLNLLSLTVSYTIILLQSPSTIPLPGTNN